MSANTLGQPRLRRSRRLWIWIAVAAGLAQIAFGFLSRHPNAFETDQDHAARLSKQHGIVVGYGDPSTFFVPPYAAHDPVSNGMTLPAASKDAVAPALDGIESSLAVYPPGFVSNLVKAIFVGGDIRVNAELSGGFAGPTWIVLAAPDSSGREGIRLTSLLGVHHELSSFILRRSEAAAAWAALSPADWKFVSTREAALAHGAGPDPALHTGFLSAYGATTSENDFNTYAEKIFTEPEKVVQLACQHALVRTKLLFVLQTYVGLDARMTQVFQGLGMDRARTCA
jgi:hypothetical protein